MPSPLERPGLDDPPLREWVVDAEDGDSLGLGEAHARELRELAKPVEYAPSGAKSDNALDDERPERESETNPIAIELVRGANGPGVDVDEWTVLIDGVRCASVLRPNDTLDGVVDVYHLPLPFKDRLSIAGGYDSVRPVVFGVRIEGEALRPAEVQLRVEQVMESTDTLEANAAPPTGWETQTGRNAEEYTTDFFDVDLPVYAPLDPTAACVATTYPFRAPAQSAFGILQINTAGRQKELFQRVANRAGQILSDVALATQRWKANAKLQSQTNIFVAGNLVGRAFNFRAGRKKRKEKLDQDARDLDEEKTKHIADIEKIDLRTEARRQRESEKDAINLKYNDMVAQTVDRTVVRRINQQRNEQLATLKSESELGAEMEKERNNQKVSFEKEYEKKKARLDKRFQKEKEKPLLPGIYIPGQPTVRGAAGIKGMSVRPESNTEPRKCTVFGGDKQSAIESLVYEFQQLMHALQISKAKTDKQRPDGQTELEYRSNVVNEMRKLLIDQGEKKAAHLLEALFCVTPTFASYRQKEAAEWLSKLDPGKESVTAKTYDGKFNAGERGFFLLLDRLFFNDLQQSNVRTRFRIRVREYGSVEWYERCLFEATKQNGFLAHAALTDANASFRQLQTLMRDFERQLIETTRSDEFARLQELWWVGAEIAASSPEVFRPVANYILESGQIARRYDIASNRAFRSGMRLWANTASEGVKTLGLGASAAGLKLFNAMQSTFSIYKDATETVQLAQQNSSFYAMGDPIRYLFLRLTTPGFAEIFASWGSGALGYLNLNPDEPPFFSPSKIEQGFQTLSGTMTELELMVQQSLPMSVYQSLDGERGIELVLEVTARTSEDDTDAKEAGAYLKALRVAETKRLQEVRAQRQLYCRMPQVVAPKELPPRSFTPPETQWTTRMLAMSEIGETSDWISAYVAPILKTVAIFGTELVQKGVLSVMTGQGWFSGKDLFEWAALNVGTWGGWWATTLATGLFGLAAAAWTPAFLVAALGSGGAVTLVAKAKLWASVTSMFNDMYAYVAGRDTANNLAQIRLVDQTALQLNAFAKLVVDYQKKRQFDLNNDRKAYVECIDKLRGDPIKMAILNANAAAAKASKRIEGVKGVNKGSLLLQGDGTRFRFYERFYAQRLDVAPFRERLHLPTPELAWTRQPDGLALRFVPPPELTERVRDGEDLRRTAMNAAIARVAETGFAPRGQSGADLARLSAKRIHTELQVALRDEWLFPASDRERVPGGRHYVTRSAPQTATFLAEHACKLLRAAFDTKVPTLVDTSDVFFDCYPGGAAARLALRHMPIVTDTAGAIIGTAIDNKTLYRERMSLFRPAKKEWTTDRKQILGALCDAWIEAAKAASRMLVPQLDLPRASREALASFGRVAALAPPEDTVARLAAAAAAAALHAVVGRKAAVARREEALRALAMADGELAGFGYQASLSVPADAPRTPSADKAAFAARRLDLDAMRKAPVGDGVDALVDALGPADLLGVDQGTEHYYVAGGDNLDFQPSPLMYSGVVAQPVWLARVAEACTRLTATLSNQAPWDDADLPEGMAVVRRRRKTDPGLARHPLVVTRRGQGEGEVVGVQLLPLSLPALRFRRADGEGGEGGESGEGTPKAATLLQALSLLCDAATPDEVATASLASDFAQRRVARARILAFNVDRCAAGLTLAATAPQTEVEAGNVSPTVTEVALALAIAGSASDQVRVRVADAERARLQLERLKERCDQATERGCKAATLAELAVAVVDLEDTSGL